MMYDKGLKIYPNDPIAYINKGLNIIKSEGTSLK